ncbi:MAG: hypothetical protein JST38_13000 [Bacteroidetes bacterium]|nr:hypothetical protein [Bacteroidota bacterium]
MLNELFTPFKPSEVTPPTALVTAEVAASHLGMSLRNLARKVHELNLPRIANEGRLCFRMHDIYRLKSVNSGLFATIPDLDGKDQDFLRALAGLCNDAAESSLDQHRAATLLWTALMLQGLVPAYSMRTIVKAFSQHGRFQIRTGLGPAGYPVEVHVETAHGEDGSRHGGLKDLGDGGTVLLVKGSRVKVRAQADYNSALAAIQKVFEDDGIYGAGLHETIGMAKLRGLYGGYEVNPEFA